MNLIPQIIDTTGLFNIYIVLTAIVLILMVLIVLVIGRIVFMRRRSSADTKLRDCSADLTMEVKELRTDDGISVDSDFIPTDRVSNKPRDDVRH